MLPETPHEPLVLLYSRLLSATATPATGSTVEFLDRVAEIPTDQLPIQLVLVDIAIAVVATVTNCKGNRLRSHQSKENLTGGGALKKWLQRLQQHASQQRTHSSTAASCIIVSSSSGDTFMSPFSFDIALANPSRVKPLVMTSSSHFVWDPPKHRTVIV